MFQAFLDYFWYADLKNVKISNFDGIFPFPLAVQSFSTYRTYVKKSKRENFISLTVFIIESFFFSLNFNSK